ncbi:2-C-methyl-D-erythritol 4-phosphate cytidylyltransferase [Diaphorobacter caeni]|uniref:2-C-methyl-D-erythritol 4-phosphate cytidylyltransferase n=1 Tax=Diaphorobacter caeni TaxID=2784387 RepID=UPI00188E47B5|nr:2-C-methyl-D-erythritol 4-phosphate cytidylyltransferase [Diaphorobacter caeni]MBF5006470.1 2-C-methyl-D-erythritol 4-phosphate cytidylyltransferase [Diaphorobacter caeni]
MNSNEAQQESGSAGARCFALLPCAGVGSRAGTAQPKQYEPLAGKMLVEHTLAAFAAVPRIAGVHVVVTPGDGTLRKDGARWSLIDGGGPTRASSVFNGLRFLLASRTATRDDWVLVHDAARCLVTPAEIDALIDACMPDAVGGLLALPLPDTLKLAVDGRSAATIDRADKWLAQTPQMFRAGALHDALEARAAQDFAGITDEASAIEAAGLRPLLVPGSAQNFKVTYPQDFALAEAILWQRANRPVNRPASRPLSNEKSKT